jgi:hypothetical protein
MNIETSSPISLLSGKHGRTKTVITESWGSDDDTLGGILPMDSTLFSTAQGARRDKINMLKDIRGRELARRDKVHTLTWNFSSRNFILFSSNTMNMIY